jgi:hypothetical protein
VDGEVDGSGTGDVWAPMFIISDNDAGAISASSSSPAPFSKSSTSMTSMSTSSPTATGIDISRSSSAIPLPSPSGLPSDKSGDGRLSVREIAGLATVISLGSLRMIVCLVIYVIRSRKGEREVKMVEPKVVRPPPIKIEEATLETHTSEAVVHELPTSRGCAELPNVENLVELPVEPQVEGNATHSSSYI